MIKTLKNTFKQDKEKFAIPSSVQQAIPIQAIWQDGIFQVGRNKFSKTFKFTDSKSLSSLGRNSYLLYLLHMQLGIALANVLFGIVSVPDFIILLTKPLIVLGVTMGLVSLIKLAVHLLKLNRFNQYIGLYSNGAK